MWKPLALFLSALLASSPALAGKVSDWLHTEGGSIRIVTEADATEEGVLRGALQIMLKPGWKTYWADPGDSGIPPSIHVTGTGHVGDPGIGFPPPRLIDDGYSEFVGYDRPMALALSFPISDGTPTGFTADIFLGVCETICIPVQASLEVKKAPNGFPAAEVVSRAFSELPREADETYHARLIEVRDDKLVVELAYPGQASEVALHVVSTEERLIGNAERADPEGSVFLLPFTDMNAPTAPLETDYILVTDFGSVTGTLRFAD